MGSTMGSDFKADPTIDPMYHQECLGKIMQGEKPEGWSDSGVDMWNNLFAGVGKWPDQHYVGHAVKVDGICLGSVCCFSVDDEDMDVTNMQLIVEASEKMGKMIEHITQPHMQVDQALPWAPPPMAMPNAWQASGGILGGASMPLPNSSVGYTVWN